MANILVTGVNGQVGSEIRHLVDQRLLAIDHQHFYFTDKETLDITDPEAVENFVKTHAIDTIINAAAYTAVDKAEDDEINADRVNHLAIRYLAQAAKEHHAKLIHISTDYVFDGKNYKPYTEEDVTNPNGVYGATKLAGEKAIQEINPDNAIIIRTSWVYSSYGANFVKTMLRLGKERDSLGVIFDQVGTPTYAKDLAKAILEIVPQLNSHSERDSESEVEIYHYSNEGVASWYDFAKAIFELSDIACQVNPIETKEYPTPAARPHYSLLNKAKIKKVFEIDIPYWKNSLDNCLNVLGEK
jgi:dTDP-4-dehydrorhamnose reductase